METRVIIADDHSIVRMGLGSLIKQFGVNEVDEVKLCRFNESIKQPSIYALNSRFNYA
jgi:DNA-binding NarL/FixJ family response regulator